MKKLLNTLYLTQDNFYLTRERDNIVIKQEGKVISRFPYRIIDGIVCFSYLGASPSLIELCAENQINLSFHTPQGRFCGRFVGQTNGNVLLRRQHYRLADEEQSLEYAKHFILAKISNSRKYLLRFKRDHRDRIDSQLFEEVNTELTWALEQVQAAENKDSLLGIEGQAANQYFRIFNDLVLTDKETFQFNGRTRRPPLDCVNRIDHFFKLIALNLNTLPFNITQFAVGFSSTNFRSLFSPMRKYFAASSMVRVYFSQIGTSV